MKAKLNLKNTEELKTFLEGVQAVVFSVSGNKSACYGFIQSVLKQFHYRTLNKSQKGIAIQLMFQVAGYSCQQLTRLIQQCQRTGGIRQWIVFKPLGFKRQYPGEGSTQWHNFLNISDPY